MGLLDRDYMKRTVTRLKPRLLTPPTTHTTTEWPLRVISFLLGFIVAIVLARFLR